MCIVTIKVKCLFVCSYHLFPCGHEITEIMVISIFLTNKYFCISKVLLTVVSFITLYNHERDQFQRQIVKIFITVICDLQQVLNTWLIINCCALILSQRHKMVAIKYAQNSFQQLSLRARV